VVQLGISHLIGLEEEKDINYMAPYIEPALDNPDVFYFLPLMADKYPYSHFKFHWRLSDCPTKPKAIYVLRNLPDVLASAMHMFNGFDKLPRHKKQIDLNQFFYEIYDRHDSNPNWSTIYGSWFEHLADALRVKQAKPERVFLVKYEDLKADLVGNIDRISLFIKGEHCENKVEIAQVCSFDYMKENSKRFNGNNWRKALLLEIDENTDDLSINKGVVGRGIAAFSETSRSIYLSMFQKFFEEFCISSYDDILVDSMGSKPIGL